MMPGGHLATSLVLSSAVYASTRSVGLAIGCAAGGFLIDFDHYLDYIVFEKEWRRPSPSSFLRYYFTHQPKLAVLPLHSFELMSVLIAVAIASPNPLLIGYILGAAMHLFFDVVVNGDFVLKHRVLFYFFSYRASKRFAASELLVAPAVDEKESAHPFREFFTWIPRDTKPDADAEVKEVQRQDV
jgi:hypothetical protein